MYKNLRQKGILKNLYAKSKKIFFCKKYKEILQIYLNLFLLKILHMLLFFRI